MQHLSDRINFIKILSTKGVANYENILTVIVPRKAQNLYRLMPTKIKKVNCKNA